MKKLFTLAIALFGAMNLAAQGGLWQQRADYTMDVKMDVKNYQYKGVQTLVYTNNSPDTLSRVFYHLYPNAFQPGSEMDMRVRNISDPDGRMVTKTTVDGKEVKVSRIKNLKPNEIGYLRIANFKQDGVVAQIKEVETILEVILAKPILPGQKSTFTLDFTGQVPLQIRRSGRNNSEGVELSMTQWYPKIAQYDFEGWHPTSYIGREFYGVWGNFDVKLTIDKLYTVGGTGVLQNPNSIGHGYEDEGKTPKHSKKTKDLTWHFIAENVHDFAWAADKNYIHDIVEMPGGPTLHFLYKNNPDILANWKKLQPDTVKLMQFFSAAVGPYPYPQYSVIQGGDGGMEYAMCTLILGNGKYDGLLGVTAHELGHTWFQHVIATNESKYGWIDEGFTSFIEDLALNEISEVKRDFPFEGAYNNYNWMAKSGNEQPQTTHADRFDINRVYSISSYSKGEVFLAQLGYLIGFDNLMKSLQRFYDEYKFKHPTSNDFIRVAEKVSGAQLGWYLTDWTMTTNTIDYSVGLSKNTSGTLVSLKRIGRMPMPIDVLVEYQDGTLETYYIPLRMMHYTKENPYGDIKRTVLKDWAWANPDYSFEIPNGKSAVKQVVIDPSGLLADIDRENNNAVAN
ncbi:MAG: M1 family metallopeptidase [Flavobacterium sp.]|nr:M1 family metallopeptidase [Flavobacterium sp.]